MSVKSTSVDMTTTATIQLIHTVSTKSKITSRDASKDSRFLAMMRPYLRFRTRHCFWGRSRNSMRKSIRAWVSRDVSPCIRPKKEKVSLMVNSLYSASSYEWQQIYFKLLWMDHTCLKWDQQQEDWLLQAAFHTGGNMRCVFPAASDIQCDSNETQVQFIDRNSNLKEAPGSPLTAVMSCFLMGMSGKDV